MKETEKWTRAKFLLSIMGIVAFAVGPARIVAQESASPGVVSVQMSSARIWLNKALDAKKAKQGDVITAKLLDDTKIPNSHDLPKNTVLLGHIDTVQPSQNKSDSSIQVTFDKAQLRDGQELPIKVTLMQIFPSRNLAVQGGGSLPADQMAPSSTGPGAARNPGGAGPPAGSRVTQGGQQDEGVDGVLLKSDIHDTNSGTFSTKGRNVYMSGGTELQVAIIVVPPNSEAK